MARFVAVLLVPALLAGPAASSLWGRTGGAVRATWRDQRCDFSSQALANYSLIIRPRPAEPACGARRQAAALGEFARQTSVIQMPGEVIYPGRSLTLEDLGHDPESGDIPPEVFERMLRLVDGGRIIRGLTWNDLKELTRYFSSRPGGFSGFILGRGVSMTSGAHDQPGPFVFRKIHPWDKRSNAYETQPEGNVLTLLEALVDWKEGIVFVGEERSTRGLPVFAVMVEGLRHALGLTAGEHDVPGMHRVEFEARHEGHDRLAEHSSNGQGMLTLVVDGNVTDPVLALSAMLSEALHEELPLAPEHQVEKRAHELLFKGVSSQAVRRAYERLQRTSEMAGELAGLASRITAARLSQELDRIFLRIANLPHQTMLDFHAGIGQIVRRARRLSPLPGTATVAPGAAKPGDPGLAATSLRAA